MRVWSAPMAVVAVVVATASCLDPLEVGSSCTRDSDCANDFECVRVDGARVCLPQRDDESEGEGENGEGEGEIGEGEGEIGEGEGEIGEGEGEIGEGEGEIGEGEGEGEGCRNSSIVVIRDTTAGAHVTAGPPGELGVVYGDGATVLFRRFDIASGTFSSSPIELDGGKFLTATDIAWNATTNEYEVLYIVRGTSLSVWHATATSPVRALELRSTNGFFVDNQLHIVDGRAVVTSATEASDASPVDVMGFVVSNNDIVSSDTIVGVAPSSRPVADGDGVTFGVAGSAPKLVHFGSGEFSTTPLSTGGAVSNLAVFVGDDTVVTFVRSSRMFMCPVGACTNATEVSFGMNAWLEADIVHRGGNSWFVAGLSRVEGDLTGPAAAVVDVTAPLAPPVLAAPIGEPAGLDRISVATFDGGVAWVVGTGNNGIRTHTLVTSCEPF